MLPEPEIRAALPHLKRYARSLISWHPSDQDDLLQDTLETAIRKSAQWTPGTDLRRWLFSIMRYEYLSYLRTQRQRGQYMLSLDQPSTFVEDDDWTPSTRIISLAALTEPEIKVEAVLAIERLQRLPVGQQQVFAMVANGYTLSEIARRLHIPLGTVASRTARFQRTMRPQ